MRILCTRNMDDQDLEHAAKWGIEIVQVPMIRVDYHDWVQIRHDYPELSGLLTSTRAIVFTSRNAVLGLLGNPQQEEALEARKTLIPLLKRKPVYTVGEATADELDRYGIMARFPDDYHATTLAEMMIRDGVSDNIVHFCGDYRRPELGIAMSDAGILVHPVIVYSKRKVRWHEASGLSGDQLPVSLDIDGIVFYSPSAVDSFFEQRLDAGYKGDWYAIGKTTATALKSRGIDPEIPRAPLTELMMEFIAKRNQFK